MINRKNLWFLTLFSLILVLSIYYITMPNELLITNNGNIELDNNSDKYDKYGRLLGYIFIDGDNLGSLLLANGLAEVKYVYGNYKYLDEFCDIQYKAYNNKLNIWNSYDYTKNYCYKRNDN